MSSQPPNQKICTRCGVDCAALPRVKDPQGRYTCRACYDAIQAAARQRRVAAAAAAPAADAIPIAEDPADDAGGMDAILADEPRACANCGQLLGSAVICMGCGYNTQTGTMTATQKLARDGRACVACGYDLSGLKTPRCPECGADNSRGAVRSAKHKREAERTVRNAYLKPALMFAIGTAIAASIYGAQDGPEVAAGYAILFAANLIVGFIVFWVCSLMWIGFDQPMHLMALQLAGVYGVTDAVSTVFHEFLPIPVFIWLIPMAVYIGLLVDTLDLDFQDAIILGIVTFIVKVVIAIGLYAQFMA